MASFHFCGWRTRQMDGGFASAINNEAFLAYSLRVLLCIGGELIWKLCIQQQRQSAGFECSAQSHSPAIYGARMNAAILYLRQLYTYAHNPKYRLLQTYSEFL
jgi:hypothetical protein